MDVFNIFINIALRHSSTVSSSIASEFFSRLVTKLAYGGAGAIVSEKVD